MKSKLIIILLIGVCLGLVAILTVLNQKTRIAVPQNMISIEGKKTEILDLSTLPKTTITGQVVNKKGDVLEVSGEGINLFDIIKDYADESYSTIIVISDDEYKATLSKEEAEAPFKAVLLIEDSSARLFVFGDTDSKRNVSNVKRIIIN